MFDLDLDRYGEAPCLLTESRQLSYRDVEEACRTIREVLPSRKQLILVRTRSCIETIVGYLAFLREGHAVIMLDGAIDPALGDSILDAYTPDLIWEEYLPDKHYTLRYGSFGLRIHSSARSTPLHPDLALLLSTSGSTGSPKMVRLSKKNLYANCRSIVSYLQIDPTHRSITNLPLHYSYGLSVLHTHLERGASLVVSDHSVLDRNFWRLVRDLRVTTLNGVPYTYEVFHRIGLMKMDLPALRYMTQAGGKLHEKLVSRFAAWARKRGILFYVMYGQTEATARISYLPPDKSLEKAGSIGIPIPEGLLSLRDLSDGGILDRPREEGELIYHGENVMMGYAHGREDLSRGDEMEGTLPTGDIAYRDEEGYFYVTGRLKRFIKLHGNRIGLDELEHSLRGIFGELLCTGVDNRLMIATLDETINEEIRNHLVDTYGFHHRSFVVKTVDSFPVTSSGKIRYSELIEVFE